MSRRTIVALSHAQRRALADAATALLAGEEGEGDATGVSLDALEDGRAAIRSTTYAHLVSRVIAAGVNAAAQLEAKADALEERACRRHLAAANRMRRAVANLVARLA